MYLCIFDFDIGCFNISEMYMFLYEVLIWVLELKWKFSCYYIFLNIIVRLMLLIYLFELCNGNEKIKIICLSVIFYLY